MTRTPGSAPSSEEIVLPPLSPGKIFLRFLRFGFLAWGGPVAQIAMLRRELVDEERWIPSGRFNRLLAIFQVLPGPEAHELCVHFGMMRGRRLGGVLAGLGFMLPGFILMFALSWLYFRMDISRSVLGPVFLGVQVGVIALIVRAVHRIGAHVVVNRWLWGIAIVSAFASFFGAAFWIVLPFAGILYPLLHRKRFGFAIMAATAAIMAAWWLTPDWQLGFARASDEMAITGASAAAPASLLELFLSGLKAGLLTFGGAYTVIPFLRDDAVGQRWLTDAQFLDGLGLSGILPAPLIIFSTFVGYAAGGPAGAIAMTVGIFLPAFSFSLLFYDRLEAVVDSDTIRTFLEGVAAGVVGLIAATTVDLASIVAGRLPTFVPGLIIFAGGLALLYFWKAKINVPVVVLGSGLAGWLAFSVVSNG